MPKLTRLTAILGLLSCGPGLSLTTVGDWNDTIFGNINDSGCDSGVWDSGNQVMDGGRLVLDGGDSGELDAGIRPQYFCCINHSCVFCSTDYPDAPGCIDSLDSGC